MAIHALLPSLVYLPLLLLSATFAPANGGGCLEGSGGDSDGAGSSQCGGRPATVDQDDSSQLLQVRSSSKEEVIAPTGMQLSKTKAQGQSSKAKAKAGEINCADQAWPCTTDTGTSARFKVAMNLDGDFNNQSPDPSYTSIYQYDRNDQKSVNYDNVVDWGDYYLTETQQFVFTGQAEDFLYGHTVNVHVWSDDDSIDGFAVSYLGGENGDFKTSYYIPKDDAGDGSGIVIDWTKIIDDGWEAPEHAGTYKYNPIHISVTPYKDGSIIGLGLMIFIAGSAYPPFDETAWCKDWDGICCYLKADDSTANTLPYNWNPADWNYANGPYGDLSKNADQCFGGSGIRPVQYDGGVITSTLNQLIKANPSTRLRIVIAAQTTIDFPLSNYYSDFSGNSGYDAGEPGFKIQITGFGRINGYAAQAIDFGDKNLFEMQARLMWISNNGQLAQQQGTSANAWRVAMGDQSDFYWYTGEKGDNDGDGQKYSIDVSHVQVGYGPPIGDAPVQLGDLEGSSGGAVLLFDAKYISFSKTADGFSMRNPASYGKALFIHGSDDLLKTVTGIDGSMPWTALAITFYAGFIEYGSLSCPCCFGPTSGYQPSGVNFCKDIIVQDLLVPMIYAPWEKSDSYHSSGLIRTLWGVKYEEDDSVFPIKAGDPIYVENIKYVNVLICNSDYNFIEVPLVNWQMSSNGHGQVTYQLDNLAVGFYNIYCDSYFRGDQGLFIYNWGSGGDYPAYVQGDGEIHAEGISAHMASPSAGVDATAPCSQGSGGELKWRVCPMHDPNQDNAPSSYTLDEATALGCGAYDDSKGAGKEEVRYQEACESLGDPGLDMSKPTLRMFGDLKCQTQFCGLRFWHSDSVGKPETTTGKPTEKPEGGRHRRRRCTKRPHMIRRRRGSTKR